MAKFILCNSCSSRFSKSAGAAALKKGHQCHVCRGLLERLPVILSSAISESASFEWKTFSVATSFPKEVFVREEEVADFFRPGQFTSLKNSVNAKLISEISSATGAKPDARNPHAIFSLDFSKGVSTARPAPLFVYGHYLKFSRQYCQSRWHCSSCGGRGCVSSGRAPTASATSAEVCRQCGGSGRNYPSIEDDIGKVLSSAFSASSYTLHASGREDVDVRALGTGRPFVIELANPKKRSCGLKALGAEMEKNQNVGAVGLRVVPKYFLDAVCNSHFEKEYSAIVAADRQLTAADAKKAEKFSGVLLEQQTPTRVLARRTDMVRKRSIIRLSAETLPGGKLRLSILAEAGTYIKELISGDCGRTVPSLSSELGCRAVCEELDVIRIYDYFLNTVGEDAD